MATPTIQIDHARCRRDGLCAAVCPLGIIVQEGRERVPQPVPGMLGWCIGCGHCVAVCPAEALRHSSMAAEDCEPLSPGRCPDADQLAALLHRRRSTRRFEAEAPDRMDLERAITMACHAPSGHNRQPLNWIVFDRREDVREVAQMAVDGMRAEMGKEDDPGRQMLYAGVVAAWSQGRDTILHDAPCLVVAHAKPRVGTEAVDAAVALGYMDLAAVSLGLGCCWAGLFMMAAGKWPPLQKSLQLPQDHRVYGALVVGKPRLAFQRAPLRKPPAIEWRSQLQT